MNPQVKRFIETYIDAIEDNSLEFVFRQAAAELSTGELSQLATILEQIGVPTESVRWSVFDHLVIDYIQRNLAAPSWQKDRSNSWARVDCMLDEISNLGFGWPTAKAHVISNGKKYGTAVRKLAPEYGWEGDGDYAFDWFDSVAFDEEYPYE